MAVANGTDSLLAITKASVWGTAVTLGSNDRLPFQSYGVDQKTGVVPNDDLLGYGTRGFPEVGNSHLEGPLSIISDFDQVPYMLLAAMIMGAAGTPTNVEAGVELHSFAYQPTTAGLFMSSGVSYGGVDEHGHSSIKPTRRVIRIPANGRMEEVYEFIGSGLDKTLATSGNWTYRTSPVDGGRKMCLNRMTTIRANADSGALDSADVLERTGIEIEINRNLQTEFAQSPNPLEPQSGDFQTIDVRLTFIGMTASDLTLFKDAKDAGTAMKLDCVVDHGVLLGSTENRKREFYFPKLKVVECPLEIPGPGPIPLRVSLTAHVASSSPTGFPTGTTMEMLELWQNSYDTDVLA